MIATANQLFDEIDRHFLAFPRRDYPLAFARSERQVEGWFKGEMIFLFTYLKQQGLLAHWDCEVTASNLSKKKIDFMAMVGDVPVYLELKTLYHGRQRGSPIDLGIYFYKDDVGIWPDVQKLAAIQAGLRYCLLFIYPSPDQMLWQRLLSLYAQRIAPITIKEVGDLVQYPPVLSISRLEVSGPDI